MAMWHLFSNLVSSSKVSYLFFRNEKELKSGEITGTIKKSGFILFIVQVSTYVNIIEKIRVDTRQMQSRAKNYKTLVI